jgi:hypothetical protein
LLQVLADLGVGFNERDWRKAMATNQPLSKAPTGADGPAYINTKDPNDLAHWARELGISVDQLLAIIKVVGNSVSAIQGEIATE